MADQYFDQSDLAAAAGSSPPARRSPHLESPQVFPREEDFIHPAFQMGPILRPLLPLEDNILVMASDDAAPPYFYCLHPLNTGDIFDGRHPMYQDWSFYQDWSIYRDWRYDETYDYYHYAPAVGVDSHNSNSNWAAAAMTSTRDNNSEGRVLVQHQIINYPTNDQFLGYAQESNEFSSFEPASWDGQNWIPEDDETIIIYDGTGQGPVRGGGLSEEQILKHLKTSQGRHVGDTSEICAVCLESLSQENESIGILNCKHEYHLGCIKHWLQQKNICPLCKAVALR